MAERQKPTPEGRELGVQIARLCDREEARQAQKLLATIPERCKTCAFRGGTIPNSMPGTLMDALHCIIEGREFQCHEHGRMDQPCAGAQLMALDEHCEIDWPWFTTDKADA